MSIFFFFNHDDIVKVTPLPWREGPYTFPLPWREGSKGRGLDF
jgi:hypothetical protein